MPYASTITASSEQPSVLLRLPEVQRRTGLSRSAIYAKIARGEFVRPARLGPNSVAWSEVEVTSWVAERLAERDSVEGLA